MRSFVRADAICASAGRCSAGRCVTGSGGGAGRWLTAGSLGVIDALGCGSLRAIGSLRKIGSLRVGAGGSAEGGAGCGEGGGLVVNSTRSSD